MGTPALLVIPALALAAALCLAMVLPYLPGRFDASAATFSFVVQAGSLVSLLMVPVGVAWIIHPGRSGLWRRVALALAGLVGFVITISAVSVDMLALGVLLGLWSILLVRTASRRLRADRAGGGHARVAFSLVWLPLILVTFRATVLPRAADWSRDRAIQHSDILIGEIEAFRQRRGHYPISLVSLNRDVPTGVVGVERFHYEPNGETYNLFFVRPHIALDAKEVVIFNPRDEHRFASHELDVLQFDDEPLNLRRGDRRRTHLAHPHWISILFD